MSFLFYAQSTCMSCTTFCSIVPLLMVKASTNVHHERGNDCYRKGDFKEALANFSRAIQTDPRNASLFTNRVLRTPSPTTHQPQLSRIFLQSMFCHLASLLLFFSPIVALRWFYMYLIQTPFIFCHPFYQSTGCMQVYDGTIQRSIDGCRAFHQGDTKLGKGVLLEGGSFLQAREVPGSKRRIDTSMLALRLGPVGSGWLGNHARLPW